MNDYQYRPLDIGHTRLVTLLPGEHHETIRILIDTAELQPVFDTRESHSPQLKADNLKSTLPSGWFAYDTVDDGILFYYEGANGAIWNASWDHPDVSVDPSLYQKPACSMQTNNDTSYEALSYTWKSSHPEEDAIVETGPRTEQTSRASSLRLGGNLACAMRHLRHAQIPRKLWIDAVCIDQSKIEERGEQVARMSSIYRNASRVVVWLGNGSEESDMAMCKLAYLGRQVILTKDNWLFCPPGAEEPYWCESACDVPYSEETWTAIAHFLMRSWFSRIWIIQEIQLAASGAVVQCGLEQMQWSHFRSAITCLWNKSTLPGPLSRDRLKFIKQLAHTYYMHSAVTDVLHLIKGRKCFDDRDYLYGVLGLLPLEFQRAIKPSYKLTIAEVYTKLTIVYLEQQRDLNILSDCHIDESNREHGLPSWVPDLSSTDRWTDPIPWQNAAGSRSAVFNFIDSQNLEVRGRTFAAVDFVEDSGDHPIDTRIHNIIRLFGIHELLPENFRVGRETVTLEVFCNTLAGGYFQERHPEESLPSLQTWKTEFANPRYLRKLMEHDPQDGPLSFHDQWAADLIRKRVFFKTCTGSFGLGPSGLQEGDIIVVLLGCDSPLALRSAPNSRYIVIGECYVDDLKDATALLGPLSSNWQVQVYKELADRRGTYRFLDRETGHIQDEDPRVPGSTRKLPMPEGASSNRNVGFCGTHGLMRSRNDTPHDQWIESEAFRASDSLLQMFILV